MSLERDFTRIAPPPSSRNVAGKTFLGRFRTVERVYVEGARRLSGTGLDLYDEAAVDLTTPFKTIVFPGGLIDGNPQNISGAAASNLWCFVTYDDFGESFKIECFGIHHAWFVPSGTGQDMTWSMVADGGVQELLTGVNPFRCPHLMGRGGADLNGDGVGDGPCEGMSLFAPVFVNSLVQYVGSLNINTSDWQVEFQGCDSDDPDADPGDGPHSPWNTLSQNCCGNSEDENDTGTGEGDNDGQTPPPPPTCGGALYCKIVSKRFFAGLGGFGYAWCLPRENGRLTDYCRTDAGPGLCYCSRTQDIAGNPIPNPSTVPVGTVMFAKCTTDNPGQFYRDCDEYQAA